MLPDDWNGDYFVSPRYYPQDTTHGNLIKRLLMYGESDGDVGYGDIPNGAVYGVTGKILNGFFPIVEKRQVNVGLEKLMQNNRKTHH